MVRSGATGVLVGLTLAGVVGPASAGVYYSGETVAELPSRWGGFLLDHRALRLAGVDRPGQATPLRVEYLAAAARLVEAGKKRPLTADESADLGALHIRLGAAEKAVSVLRPAARAHPQHFRIAANLGTAWQLAGDPDQAAAALAEAVRLAPEAHREVERNHLKLVRLRAREGPGRKVEAPDDLFGVAFTDESGKPAAGRIAPAQRERLPGTEAATVQALALALPADGRLLWQVAELANAQGDVRTAAAVLDGCVTEFGMGSADLRARRRLYRAAADKLARKPGHEAHRGAFTPKSPRPLVRKFDASALPAARADGPNPLPWGLLNDSTLGGDAGPTFPAHLARLDGKTVAATGFMQPVGDAREFTGFLLLEFPVGCWFCETPSPTGLISVELPPGKSTSLKRGLVKVTGVLRLNRDNPEDFAFRVTNAVLGEPE